MSPSPPALFQKAHDFTISEDAQFNVAGRDVIVYGSRSSAPAALHDLLSPVSNATHTRAGHVARCDPGTRLEVITQIEQRLNGSDRRAAICWLSGPAGYGKSAVAQTIAERYAAKGRLLGCFFFLRGAGERSHISRLIPTLAHQVSLSVPAVKPLLEKALRDEPAMLGPSVSLAHQFQKLIIEPIHSTTSKVLVFSHLAKQKIFVIDALDECDDKAEMAAFIDVLLNAFPERSYLPFRVLLTSRVEEHIRKKFVHAEARFLYHLDLGNFDARSDIQVYFTREFARIFDENCQMMQRIPKPWPSAKDLSELLDKAGRSFAFAMTLIQFVGGGSMPHEALQQLLELGADGLDPIYKHVLSSASGTTALYQILGTIMILEDNKSISFLSSLLNLQHDKVIYELLGVQSIIKIPGDDNEPIMLYHTSLRDFLTLKSRSEQYFIDPPLQHLHLAIHCLKHLAEYPSKDFFEGDVAMYACFSWPHHIFLGFQEQTLNMDETITTSLVTLIKSLLTFHSKTWYNTMLTFEVLQKTRMLECVRDGKNLFQTSQGSIVTRNFIMLLEQIIDFCETVSNRRTMLLKS
ncbi:hypothetical protein K443DRAFT_683576 [Laccaria amethystina LaAM-08-1]|uniref:Nephrocystin 3-like N-terminal domain-containing protein n=1 Tax=Laccaria amethystina LaAM-08-1 TaxID=1095629 RepID=A0A0C9WSI4_9AGAR|nr:hypothetical protein K443DRAFT_683576 [Laccaria amethystina LaAM-08-1]